jgi:hypothetical protein
MSYRAWAANFVPAWLQSKVGSALVSAYALVFDFAAQLVDLSGEAGMLASFQMPDDALPYFGAERKIPRYPTETSSQYRSRLQQAWTYWAHAGTKQGMLELLSALGFTAQVLEPPDWHFQWDGNTADWSRFWIELDGHPWAPLVWGDRTQKLGGGSTWGSTASPAEIAGLRRLIRLQKPGHVRCEYIFVVLDPDAWNHWLTSGLATTVWERWHDTSNLPANSGVVLFIPG